MISETESGRVSKEIPGSGSGSGTRWALPKTLFSWFNRSLDENAESGFVR